MNQKEKIVIITILLLTTMFIGVDIIIDSKEGVVLSHVLGESLIGLISLFGVFYILKRSANLKLSLKNEKKDFEEFKKMTEEWKKESKKYSDGLSLAIDHQLEKWVLSPAEKEIAFLLLKGLSLKEIASIRNTAEKTTRTQSISIYSKSGLSGRSELSAFFLEDLLAPKK